MFVKLSPNQALKSLIQNLCWSVYSWTVRKIELSLKLRVYKPEYIHIESLHTIRDSQKNRQVDSWISREISKQ